MGQSKVDPRGLTIGVAAEAVGTTPRGIRLYEAQGLMPRPERERGNCYRRYHTADLQRLRFIKRAQSLGFSLAEIAELLVLDSEDCTQVQHLARAHLATVDDRLTELRKLRRGLRAILSDCQRATTRSCPILRALGHD